MQCGNFPPARNAHASENVALAPLQIRSRFAHPHSAATRRRHCPPSPDIVYGCSGAAGAEMRGSVVLATAPCLSPPRNWPRESR